MVCPQCGTLNPNERERCFRCEHSLSRAHVAEEVHCRRHSDQVRAANCSVCAAPMCETCAIRVGDVTYCPDCAAVPGQVRETTREVEQVFSPLQMETFVCAPIHWRFVAGAIDGAILLTGAIVLALLFWMLGGVPPGMPWADGTNVLYWLLVFLGAGAYFVGYHVTAGETPGYGATDLLLLSSDGKAITLPAAVLRYLVSIVSAAFCMLGYLWMIWDPDSQTWHDKAAGTCVLRTGVRKDVPPDEPTPANLPDDVEKRTL